MTVGLAPKTVPHPGSRGVDSGDEGPTLRAEGCQQALRGLAPVAAQEDVSTVSSPVDDFADQDVDPVPPPVKGGEGGAVGAPDDGIDVPVMADAGQRLAAYGVIQVAPPVVADHHHARGVRAEQDVGDLPD